MQNHAIYCSSKNGIPLFAKFSSCKEPYSKFGMLRNRSNSVSGIKPMHTLMHAKRYCMLKYYVQSYALTVPHSTEEVRNMQEFNDCVHLFDRRAASHQSDELAISTELS